MKTKEKEKFGTRYLEYKKFLCPYRVFDRKQNIPVMEIFPLESAISAYIAQDYGTYDYYDNYISYK